MTCGTLSRCPVFFVARYAIPHFEVSAFFSFYLNNLFHPSYITMTSGSLESSCNMRLVLEMSMVWQSMLSNPIQRFCSFPSRSNFLSLWILQSGDFMTEHALFQRRDVGSSVFFGAGMAELTFKRQCTSMEIVRENYFILRNRINKRYGSRSKPNKNTDNT